MRNRTYVAKITRSDWIPRVFTQPRPIAAVCEQRLLGDQRNVNGGIFPISP